MPWNTKSSNQMIREFIQKATQPDVTMAELCREYNISRKTGYKWLKRYRQEEALRGESGGLKDLGKSLYEVWFGDYLLGVVDEEQETFRPQQEGSKAPRVIKARKKHKAAIREFD